MNAVLAKPIPPIWFIQAGVVDLNQSLAAALRTGLPFWLRDHSSWVSSAAIVAPHNHTICSSPISVNGAQNAG
jgi:hypothetical protein